MNSTRCIAKLVVICLVPCSSTVAKNNEAKTETKLPPAVRKTFDEKFPKAKIEKLDVEKENGVEVYDFEFADGKAEKECDIAADGTLIEYTLVITTKDVPDEAMKPIEAAAKGATTGRTEKIEVSYDLKDGKIIKLPKRLIEYAVEMKKDDEHAEIIVDEHGKIIEQPKWEGRKPKKAS
jgi:hypothetical protein